MNIKAIETRAYGCLFRSRLESRWSVFFTEAGFHWEYEPEGFETEAGRYLPDFWITSGAVSIWLEVKPVVDTHDDPRWALVASGTGMMLFTVRGMHRTGDDCERDHRARVWHPDGSVADVIRLWQGAKYTKAWDAASAARFDGTGPALPKIRKRRKR